MIRPRVNRRILQSKKITADDQTVGAEKYRRKSEVVVAKHNQSLSTIIVILFTLMSAVIISLGLVSNYLTKKTEIYTSNLYDHSFVSVHYSHLALTDFVRLEARHTGSEVSRFTADDLTAVEKILDELEVCQERATTDHLRLMVRDAETLIRELHDQSLVRHSSILVIDKKLTRLSNKFNADALDGRLISATLISDLSRYLSILSLGAVAVAAFIVVLLLRTVVRPMRLLIAAMRAEGEFAPPAELVQRTDELGQMVRSLQDLEAQRKAKVAAESASIAKSEFVANMSHEIRTPLNGVLGMARAMATDDLSSTQRERLEVIQESGAMLLAILNDVLDLSKIEAGKLELEHASFDLVLLARGAQAAFTALAHKAGLSFNLTVDEDAAGAYIGDSTRVRQILYNLTSNALKFTRFGEVRVEILRSNPGIILRIRDTGIGMSSAQVSRLFQKFEQADSSTTRRFGGTGLGLSICRDLAELMGGTISVDSVEGKGSVFSVHLPLERSTDKSFDPKIPVDPLERAADEAIEMPPLRVLAAEDNHVNQLVLKTLLHQVGIQPTIVGDGQAAVEAAAAANWDIILLDIQMPIMDGMDAARTIRERERLAPRSRTPIIALTANAMSHQIKHYLELGMDAVVAKPIEVQNLLDTMVYVLDKASAEPELATSTGP